MKNRGLDKELLSLMEMVIKVDWQDARSLYQEKLQWELTSDGIKKAENLLHKYDPWK